MVLVLDSPILPIIDSGDRSFSFIFWNGRTHFWNIHAFPFCDTRWYCCRQESSLRPLLPTADRSTGDEPVPEPEKRQTSDSGQELDRRSDAASAEGESDTDEEDNADTAW